MSLLIFSATLILENVYDLPNGCFCICFIEPLNFPIYAMVIYH